MPRKKLTIKEQRFVEEMAKPKVKSVRQAALSAGYAETTASVHVYKMLENLRISEAIQKRIARASAHHKVTPEEVVGAAVFNMRTSIDDCLNEGGSFDISKARETGAIDIIKKHKETRKTVYNPQTKGSETTVVVEIELESPAAARKEVASYIGLEKAPQSPIKSFSDEELAKELIDRMISRGHPKEQVIEAVRKRFPDITIDIKGEE